MRSSLTPRVASWRRVAAAVAVATLPLAALATGAPALAQASPTSPVEVFIDSVGNGDLNDALLNGWWGHEGGSNNGTGAGSSVFDLNVADADFGTTFPDISKIRVAFVTSSASGANEKPAVSAGQTVDQVFPWFMDAGFGTALNGNTNPNDGVDVVSTGAEYDSWFAAGQPVQGFNNALQVLDVTAPGNPVSATPKGKSILNRWATGSHISVVYYVTTGAVVNGKPVVAVGPGGKAITAHMRFDTVAKPSDATRTSAGYVAVDGGAVAQNSTTTLTTSVPSPQASGTNIDLTANVGAATGTDVPAGSVEFFDGATSLGTGSLTAGVAHKNGVALGTGNHSLTAVYTPVNTQTLAFNASTSAAVPYVITATATSVAAGATPGVDVSAPVVLTAQAPAGVAGSVVWKDGGVTVAGPTAVDGSGFATENHVFTLPGSHTVTATFTPTSSSFAPSSGSVTFILAAPSGVSVDEQSITATIPVGTITVTTPYTPASPLDLGTLALTPALDGYKGSATFNDIHVVDTRDGALPWALTALASNLTDGAATPHFINGQNLGLTALIAGAASNPGIGTITTTDNPVPAVPVAPASAGSLGLGGTPHTVLSANKGPSNVVYSGTLTLFAPTTTVAGLYTGTITFTAS